MSRRKARKPRRQRPEDVGKVTVHIECGSGVTVQVAIPDYTADQYRKAQEQAQAGDIHAPEIWQLVEAFSAAIGHDLDASLWGDEDLRKLTRYMGLVDADAWTAVDEQELSALLGGEGADDVR